MLDFKRLLEAEGWLAKLLGLPRELCSTGEEIEEMLICPEGS
jgi:hypothetical protein